MDAIWNILYDEAKKVLNPRKISEWMEAGGVCRELMTQLMPEKYRGIEVMLDYEKGEVVTLGELTPKWWI